MVSLKYKGCPCTLAKFSKEIINVRKVSIMNKHHREEHEKMGRHHGRHREKKAAGGQLHNGNVAKNYPHAKYNGEIKKKADSYPSHFADLDKALCGDYPTTNMHTVRGESKSMRYALEGKAHGGEVKGMMHKKHSGKKYAAGGVGKMRHDAYD